MGDRRHYAMATILPRHFMQTAVRNGMDPRRIDDACAGLADTAEVAMASVLESLPKDFPADLVESVVGGVRARLSQIKRFLA